MLVVTVELWPGGNEEQKWHLGTARIVNDGAGSLEGGNYTVTLSRWGLPTHKWRSGVVKDFPRKRLGPWDLLCRALNNVVGDRNV